MYAEIGDVPALHVREHYQVHGRLAVAGGALQRGRVSLHGQGPPERERAEKGRDAAKLEQQHGEQGSTTGVIAGCAMDGRCVPDPKRGGRSADDVESGGIRRHASGEVVLPGDLQDVMMDDDTLWQVEKILRCQCRQVLVCWKG